MARISADWCVVVVLTGVSVAVRQNPNLQRPPPPPTQSVEEIQRLVQMARTVGPVQPSSIDTGEHQDTPHAPASSTLHIFGQFTRQCSASRVLVSSLILGERQQPAMLCCLDGFRTWF
jgi:hypothetical protein